MKKNKSLYAQFIDRKRVYKFDLGLYYNEPGYHLFGQRNYWEDDIYLWDRKLSRLIREAERLGIKTIGECWSWEKENVN